MSEPEPYDLSWLITGEKSRTEPIRRATADDELFVIESNPTHIEWGYRDERGRYPASLHIGYHTEWGSVALCGVGNDKIPTGCRCAPWNPKPERQEIDCADCYAIARSLHDKGEYPDKMEGRNHVR